MTVIYFSDGYKGGAATYLEQNILFNIKKKEQVILFDRAPNKTYINLKKNKLLKVFKLDIIKDRNKVKKILNNIKNIDTPYFFFTNYIILIYYYLFLKRFNSGISKITITLHSGVFNYNLKIIIALLIFSLLALKIDKLIFGSFSSKKWWLNLFPWMKIIRNKVIFNGVEAKYKKTKKTRAIYNISFIGRMETENDPKLFFDIAVSNKNLSYLKFNIFGDGSYKKIIQKEKSNITFWGWTKQKIIYDNTDIVIITSPLNNFPYVALESQSYGIPVITAAVGDIRKIVKHNYNGFLLQDREVDTFTKSIKQVIKNYNKLSNNSFNNAKNYNMDNSCTKVWRFIKIENNNFR